MTKTCGDKYDEGKPDYSLLPVYGIEQMVKVLTFGKNKYEADNWRRGVETSRCVSAMERHIAAYKTGEDIDLESGIEHLAHVMCTCAFLMEFKFTHPEKDDRYPEQVTREGKLRGVLKKSNHKK